MPIARDEARMLGLLADDEATICWAMGFASAQPILVWGCGSQEAIIAAISFSKRGISVSWFGRGCFFVPATILRSAARSRRQGWPALWWRGGLGRIQATPWRRGARCEA